MVGSKRPRRSVGLAARFIVAALLTLAVGCGPVQSTQGINDAKVALERARVAEAHKKAPYEYYSAKYYLHKAQEEWGYSDFENAVDYAEVARKSAQAARRNAKEDPWQGSPAAESEPADQSAESSGNDADEASDGESDSAADTGAEAGPQGF